MIIDEVNVGLFDKILFWSISSALLFCFMAFVVDAEIGLINEMLCSVLAATGILGFYFFFRWI